MREWTRAMFATRCGSCRRDIGRGDVVLEIRPVTTDAKLVRCQGCGVEMFGEAAPELPPLSPAPQPSLPIARGHEHGFVRFERDSVQRDFRLRRTGE